MGETMRALKSSAVFLAVFAGTVGLICLSARADESGGIDPILRGQALFKKQCAICHGDNGDGQGKFAYLMNPRPRNFLAGKFKLATTENLIPSDADLFNTIRRGMPGSAMPPWDHLPVADLTALVNYVRHLRGEAARNEVEQAVAEGTYTEEEAAEVLSERTEPGPAISVPPEAPFENMRWFTGRKIYLQACASCHGVDGRPVAEAVKFDEDGYPNPPRSFVDGIFKGGMEGHQLYARIVKGMRGTPMPGFEGTYCARWRPGKGAAPQRSHRGGPSRGAAPGARRRSLGPGKVRLRRADTSLVDRGADRGARRASASRRRGIGDSALMARSDDR